MVQFRDVVDLIGRLTWPLVVLLLALAFRKELPQLVRSLLARISRVSAAGLALEFTARRLEESAQSILADLREPALTSTVRFPEDAKEPLMRLIRERATADYAVIDLGDGDRWLTSRLYLFAQVLDRFLGVRALVFVQNSGDVSERFAGLAEPRAVARRLGARFPWLEAAHLAATAKWRFDEDPIRRRVEAFLTRAEDQQEIDDSRPLPDELEEIARESLRWVDWTNSDDVALLVTTYLGDEDVRRPADEAAKPAPGWVRLMKPDAGGDRYDEHAEWILGEPQLKRLLGDALSTTASIDSAATASETELVRRVLVQKRDYVATTDSQGRFTGLIDTRAVLSAFGRRQTA